MKSEEPIFFFTVLEPYEQSSLKLVPVIDNYDIKTCIILTFSLKSTGML
jgi:hypothetical protein